MSQYLVFPMMCEETTTEGQGDIFLTGAKAGFLPVSQFLNNGEKGIFKVSVTASGLWEQITAVYDQPSNSLTQIAVIRQNDGSDNKIDWTAGTKTVEGFIEPSKFLSLDDGNKYHVGLPMRWHGPNGEVYEHRVGSPSGDYRIEYNPDAQAPDTPIMVFRYDVSSGFIEFTEYVKSLKFFDAPEIRLGGIPLTAAATKTLGIAQNNLALLGVGGVWDQSLLPPMGAASVSAAGSAGKVPVPPANSHNKQLFGDATYRSAVLKAVESAYHDPLVNDAEYTWTHGLGAIPDFCLLEVVVKTAQHDWNVGDTFMLPFGSGDLTISLTASQAKARIERVRVLNSGMTQSSFTAANVKVRMHAFRYNV